MPRNCSRTYERLVARRRDNHRAAGCCPIEGPFQFRASSETRARDSDAQIDYVRSRIDDLSDGNRQLVRMRLRRRRNAPVSLVKEGAHQQSATTANAK